MYRYFLTLMVVAGCASNPTIAPRSAPEGRTVTFLHINDVYEITPVSGGASGGMARLATLTGSLRATTPAVITTLGGDFLSPSAMGLAVVGGQRLAGRQMVAVLNAIPIDWAVLGNHEFDLRENEFRDRIRESRFGFVASNVRDASGGRFHGTVSHAIVTVATTGGTVRIGLIGLTIASNNPAWVQFENPVDAARREVALLRDSVDVIVALTHLTLAEDQVLVGAVPDIALVLGGHEHDNYEVRRGPAFTPIIKADANARTAAVVTLTLPSGAARAVVSSRLVVIDATTPEDADVAREVASWVARSDTAYVAQGLDPHRDVTTITELLDGREAAVRTRSGVLTTLIADALRNESPGAEVGLMNGGSIRIDDVLPAGPVTQYDVIRVLPFGGQVVGTTMTGALLLRVLNQGEANRGSGGFLHFSGVTRDGTNWMVGSVVIDPTRRYRVATTDFLLSGRETGLSYLAPGNAELGPITAFRDIRVAVIDELRRRYPPRP